MAIIVVHCVSGYFILSYNQLESVRNDFSLLLESDPFYSIGIPVFSVLDKVWHITYF
jgi:hypothetical protein